MSKIGFGGYRISSKSDDHRDALSAALDKGISLIDTSSNYTDGESELLIGELLKQRDNKPLIISKVGYIQGINLDVIKELNDKDLAIEDLVVIDSNLKHSIHPDFIEDQISRTLSRLGLESLDVYLLHNPEYYLKTEGSDKKEYYRRIKLAFEKMEELVERGLIKYYGVSSNTFVDPKDDHTSTDLDILFGAARDITENHHFKYIQFPMNMLEMGALERQYDGEHLIERANTFGIKTIINRPLNCFTEQGLLRLAEYEVDEKYNDPSNADEIFNKSIDTLVVKWLEVREDEGDKLFDLPIMNQLQQIWYKQTSIDAINQIFFEYFFPLIASIWGENLSAKESAPFYDLFEHAVQFTKANMNKRAKQFADQATDKGLLFESDQKLSKRVIEKYQTFGVDYILVGMRSVDYVEDLKEYF